MPNYATLSGNITIAGVSMTVANSVAAETATNHILTAVKGYSGTLSTRLGDTSGTVTASGHNILENDKVDIYWNGGVAYGGTAGVIAGNDIPVTGLSGDVLPAQMTEVTISFVETCNVANTEVALLLFFCAFCEARAHFRGISEVPAVLLARELLAGQSNFWMSGQGWANPFGAGTLATIDFSTAATDADQTLTFGLLIDTVT